uniref:Uncharacterized protein n=1 Tax=Anguilla anguilla TaxID=7936 RepID=A0A0E9TU78_ANGAN
MVPVFLVFRSPTVFQPAVCRGGLPRPGGTIPH